MSYRPPLNYGPCPKCGATVGMGLTSRKGEGFVWHPDCGAEGPRMLIDLNEPTAHDRAAIEGWNAMLVNSRDRTT